ncbi:unnamed protein product, partial [marine sediment metagenome]
AENTAKLNFLRDTSIWTLILIQGIVLTVLGSSALAITRTPVEITGLNWTYGAFIAIYLIGYFYAIKMLPVSIAVPFGQLSTIFTVLIAIIFLHEVLKPIHIGGIVLVVAGATLLAVK